MTYQKKIISNLKILFSTEYFKDILLQSSGNTFAQILSICFIPVLSRLYTPEEFGYLSMFLVFSSFLSILITFRLEYFIVTPLENEVALNLINFIFLSGLTITFIITLILALNPNLIFSISAFSKSSNLILFAPLTAFVSSFSIASQQMIQRRQSYLKSGISEILNKTAYFTFAILIYFIYKSFVGLILATFVGLLLKTLWLIYLNNGFHRIRINLKESFEVAKVYRQSAISFSISNLFLIVTGYVPIYIISKYFTASDLGFWHLVTSVVYIPTSFIGIAIGQVYYERAAKLISSGLSLQSIWFSTLKILVSISIPLFLLISFLSPFAFSLFFGKNWEVAGQYASIFSIAAAFSFISSPLDRTCYLVGKIKYPFLLGFCRMLASIGAGLVCVYYNSSIYIYLWVHVIQASLMYIIDLYFGWSFVSRKQF